MPGPVAGLQHVTAYVADRAAERVETHPSTLQSDYVALKRFFTFAHGLLAAYVLFFFAFADTEPHYRIKTLLISVVMPWDCCTKFWLAPNAAERM